MKDVFFLCVNAACDRMREGTEARSVIVFD